MRVSMALTLVGIQFQRTNRTRSEAVQSISELIRTSSRRRPARERRSTDLAVATLAALRPSDQLAAVCGDQGKRASNTSEPATAADGHDASVHACDGLDRAYSVSFTILGSAWRRASLAVFSGAFGGASSHLQTEQAEEFSPRICRDVLVLEAVGC